MAGAKIGVASTNKPLPASLDGPATGWALEARKSAPDASADEDLSPDHLSARRARVRSPLKCRHWT